MGRVYTTTGIALTDTSGGTVVDPSGIVSTTQFTQARGTNSADNQAITGTAVTSLNNGTLSFVLDRSALVLYLFTADAYMVNTSNGCHIYPQVNGTIPLAGAGKYHIALAASNINLRAYTSYHIETLPSGTNTIILSASLTDDAVGTCTVTRWKADYLILGK